MALLLFVILNLLQDHLSEQPGARPADAILSLRGALDHPLLCRSAIAQASWEVGVRAVGSV